MHDLSLQEAVLEKGKEDVLPPEQGEYCVVNFYHLVEVPEPLEVGASCLIEEIAAWAQHVIKAGVRVQEVLCTAQSIIHSSFEIHIGEKNLDATAGRACRGAEPLVG